MLDRRRQHPVEHEEIRRRPSRRKISAVAARHRLDAIPLGVQIVTQQRRKTSSSSTTRMRAHSHYRSLHAFLQRDDFAKEPPTLSSQRTAAIHGVYDSVPRREIASVSPLGARSKRAAAPRPRRSTASAMLVARSPMRLMFFTQNIRWMQTPILQRVFHHLGEEFAKQRGADGVDLIAAVHSTLPPAPADLCARIGVENTDLSCRPAPAPYTRARKPRDQLERSGIARPAWRTRLPMFLARPPIRSRSAAKNAQRADDRAQVHRHRLTPRDGEDSGAFFDLALQAVDATRSTAIDALARAQQSDGSACPRISTISVRRGRPLSRRAQI